MRIVLLLCLSAVLLSSPRSARAADTFRWRTNQNLVSADIKSSDLLTVLEKVVAATHWKVFLEPGTTHAVSTKFKDLPPGEALRLLLGDVNFAVVPGTNSSSASTLYVFRTRMQKATQSVIAARPSTRIPNELIVRLKPGANIDDIARKFGAKVAGRIAGLNAYRLQFDSQAAADAARAELSSTPDVASVDYNYSIARPGDPATVPSNLAAGANFSLELKPPPDDGRVIVGLVDTEVQPLCDNLNSFLLPAVSIATGDPSGQAAAPSTSAADSSTPTHGTSMASTILHSLQQVTGGKTSVQILPVNVYGANQATSTFDVANGVISAVNGGAKIINLSLGSDSDSPFLHQVIQQVTAQNIAVFAAAGNQPVTTAFYPAAYPEVNAVTAIDKGQLAPYANRGSFVSLGAPGDSMFCYQGQTYLSEGTSDAASYISGVAAGYMENSQASVPNTENFLRSNFGVKITTK
jgi:subtilase family protein/fervidolysin-like protein